jgi:predicted nucleic acid-binding Zn ribbon protein
MTVEACEACGKELSSNETKCPHCGETPKRRRKSVFEKIIYVLVIILALFALFGPFEKKTDKPSSAKTDNVGTEAINDKPIPSDHQKTAP